jgi:two-component system sensor histidine kinase PilS (NtrC family)
VLNGKLLRRYAAARAALAIGSCALLLPSTHVDLAWATTVVVLAIASIAVVYLAHDRVRQTVAVIGGDIALALVMIPVTGSQGSPYLPLLCMAVVLAGTNLGARAALVTTCASVTALHAAFFTGIDPFHGGIEALKRISALWGNRETLVRLYTATTFLVVLGVLSSYVGRLIRRRSHQLERVRAELKQRRLDTDTIVDSLSTGLISLSAAGRIVLMNRAAGEVLGLPELPPDRTATRVLSGRLAAVSDLLLESLGSGEVQNRAMIRLADPQGGPDRLIGLSAVPVRQEYQVVGVVGIFRDITELKAEEAETRRRERLASIGEVAAGIVHELRNILKPLSGTVELLEGDVQHDDAKREQVRLIRHECDALEAFLDEILQFAGDAPLDVARHDVTELMNGVAARVKAAPDGARAEVRVECPDGLHVDGDGRALARMLQNLVLNSVQVKPGARVVLAAEETAGGITIRVADDGPGLDRGVQEKMFEPFFTKRSGGTGLGLAVTKRTVERHGGSITARNAEGGGAVFEIALPRSPIGDVGTDMAA